MNTGIISKRYATALLKFTDETGNGERVFQQVREMLAHPDSEPSRIEPEIGKLVELLVKRGRMEYVRFIFHSFVKMYCESEGIILCHLTMAVPTPGLEEKIRELLEAKTESRVLLEAVVDPSLVGGFALEVDGYMLDASVKRTLDRLRRQFIISNNRTV